MTYEERQRLLDVIASADGGCASCVRDLLKKLDAAFPEFDWMQEFGSFNYETIHERRARAEELEDADG